MIRKILLSIIVLWNIGSLSATANQISTNNFQVEDNSVQLASGYYTDNNYFYGALSEKTSFDPTNYPNVQIINYCFDRFYVPSQLNNNCINYRAAFYVDDYDYDIFVKFFYRDSAGMFYKFLNTPAVDINYRYQVDDLLSKVINKVQNKNPNYSDLIDYQFLNDMLSIYTQVNDVVIHEVVYQQQIHGTSVSINHAAIFSKIGFLELNLEYLQQFKARVNSLAQKIVGKKVVFDFQNYIEGTPKQKLFFLNSELGMTSRGILAIVYDSNSVFAYQFVYLPYEAFDRKWFSTATQNLVRRLGHNFK